MIAKLSCIWGTTHSSGSLVGITPEIVDIKSSVLKSLVDCTLRIWAFYLGGKKKRAGKTDGVERTSDCSVRHCDLLKEFKPESGVVRFEF